MLACHALKVQVGGAGRKYVIEIRSSWKSMLAKLALLAPLRGVCTAQAVPDKSVILKLLQLRGDCIFVV